MHAYCIIWKTRSSYIKFQRNYFRLIFEVVLFSRLYGSKLRILSTVVDISIFLPYHILVLWEGSGKEWRRARSLYGISFGGVYSKNP